MPLWNDDKNIMLVAGHRGARRIRPENTMTAFNYAIDLGVDMVETDIRQTKDGQLVLMHDARVDRTTDGSGLVRDHTFAEFRRLNAAAHDDGFAPEKPPLLEELLERGVISKAKYEKSLHDLTEEMRVYDTIFILLQPIALCAAVRHPWAYVNGMATLL